MTHLDEHDFKPYRGEATLIKLLPDAGLQNTVDETNVFFGFCLSYPSSNKLGWPRQNYTFSTSDNEVVGTFSNDGNAYDKDNRLVSNVADHLEETEEPEMGASGGGANPAVHVTTRALTVARAAYVGGEIPSRVGEDHPLATLVAYEEGDATNPDLYVFADTVGRFRSRVGGANALMLRWEQTNATTYTIYDEEGPIAYLHGSILDDEWVLGDS